MIEKNYNATRDKLILPEYGRNVISMVNALLEISDRDERTRQAQIVIDVMGNINPTLRDSNDYKHKIWDHLFILADFKLDIDSPYEIPSREALRLRPEKIEYTHHHFTHKQYGNNVREVIKVLCENGNKDEIVPIAVDIAKFMKQKSFEYNKEYPSNEVVLNDIRKFSGDEIVLDEDTLNKTYISVNKPVRAKSNNGANLPRSVKPMTKRGPSPIRVNTTKK